MNSDLVFQAAEILFTFRSLLLIAACAIVGVIFGAIPGLGPTLTLALFFPFTLIFPPEVGLMCMAVLYASSTYGGSISAILINVPGTAGSIATLLDGYPMTKRGEGVKAVGIATTASFIGGSVGLVLLIIFAPIIAQISLILNAADLFLLAVLGLSTVAAVSRGPLMKSLASGCFGMFIATIGFDPFTGGFRYTFGSFYLQSGIELIVVVIGMFAIAETLALYTQGGTIAPDIPDRGLKQLLDGPRVAMQNIGTSVRGGLIGTIIGSVPGAGIAVANFLSYILEMNVSNKTEEFGTGEPRGIIAAESANNGSAMGALIPALALAIPGGAAAAVFIGAMLSYGVTPGPNVFNTTLPYVIFLAILIGNLCFLSFGLLGSFQFARITTLSHKYIIIGILIMSFAGSFAIRNNFLDIVAATIIGIATFALQQREYSAISFIIGFILSPIAEPAFRRSLRISGGDYSIFVESPISIALIILSIIMFTAPILMRARKVA